MKLFKFILLILKTKWSFKIYKKCDILLYTDKPKSIFFKNIFKDVKINVVCRTQVEINIVLLFLSFLFFLKSKDKLNDIYFYLLNKISSPKLIVTTYYNEIFFYNLKKNINTPTAIIQTGYQGYTGDVFETLFKKKQKYFVNYKFLFSKSSEKLFNKFIKGQSIIVGSFKNNFIKKVNCQNISKNTIAYISQFRITRDYLPDAKIIKFLDKYCYENSLKINVYLMGSPHIQGKSAELYNKEIYFYSKLLKKTNYVLKVRSYDLENYKNLKKENLIITIDSTLGYEMLALDKKVLFFSIRDSDSNYLGFCHKKSHNFGWPENLPNNGFFWSNNYDHKKFTDLINSNINLTCKNWHKKNSKIIKKIIIHDYLNSKLKSKVNEILN